MPRSGQNPPIARRRTFATMPYASRCPSTALAAPPDFAGAVSRHFGRVGILSREAGLTPGWPNWLRDGLDVEMF